MAYLIFISYWGPQNEARNILGTNPEQVYSPVLCRSEQKAQRNPILKIKSLKCNFTAL